MGEMEQMDECEKWREWKPAGVREGQARALGMCHGAEGV